MFPTRPLWVVQEVGVVFPKITKIIPCVQAALVTVGPVQDQAAVAGVSGLTEGGGGVNGVPSASQDICGVQELSV